MNVRLAKGRLSLIKRQPFFGRLCIQLEPVETENIPTFATDGEYLFYNKKFLDSVTDDHLLGILVHETLHAALGHIWRRLKKDPHRWNIACDYAVNLIVEANRFQLPEGALFEYSYRNMSAEEIYKKLPPTITIEMCAFGGGGDDDLKDGKKKKSGGSSQNCPCGSSHKMWKKAEGKKNKRQLERRWQAAMEEVSKLQGKIPAGFERIIQDMAAKEDWREILANYLSSSTSDFDFMRRDRRSFSSDFYLPDLADESSLENVVVALDTSGSISEKELNSFVSEVKSILRSFSDRVRGWIIDCDADVHKVEPIDKAKIKTKYYGGGGTSHEPVFREIAKRNLDPKVVLCFTDLYTDFPKKSPQYPVLWLLTPEGDQSCKVPFGRVVKMKR